MNEIVAWVLVQLHIVCIDKLPPGQLMEMIKTIAALNWVSF